MPTNPEAARLNLEFYRKQAKSLLKAAQSGDAATLARIVSQSPNMDPAAPKLHDAQLAVAREQGFPSWPRFRAFLIQSGLDFQSLVAAFIDGAVSDRRRAEQILLDHPKVEDAGFYADLVLGNARRVEEVVSESPALATARSGPQNCEPLLYVCFSRFAGAWSPRAGGLVETAKVLLRHGADPNTVLLPPDLPDNPLSCLYAATGLNNNPALATVLLEAGANPDDNESLFHSTEQHDLVCVKLLLRHGAKVNGTNTLKHMLDREHVEGVRLLLEAGADPNETNAQGETALHWAVWRGRSIRVVQLLLDDGAEVDARRSDGRTAYALALLCGDRDVATLLQARGATAAVAEDDRILAAYTTASPEDRKQLPTVDPRVAEDRGRVVSDLAASHRTEAVHALLAAGMPVDARGDAGATALHWACWKGYADLVEVLLAHGASLTVEDEEFHGTPAGWFGHGSQNCIEGVGDYAQVARLLLGAGASIPKADLPTGRPEVDEVLREHGLL